MRRLAMICAPLLLLGAILGHHHHPHHPQLTPRPTTSSGTVATTAPASPASAPAFPPVSDPTWTRAAEQFMRAYARPHPGAEASWAAAVNHWLAPSTQAVFATTNPRNVPFTTVTGHGVLHDAGVPVDVLALAEVPTDHGPWYVAMVRRHGAIQVVWYGTDPTEMPQ